MREYLLAKFPDPIERPLQSNERSGLVNGKGRERRDEKEWVLAEYKGAIYGKQCLESQEVILEYLLGKCLEQCRMCLEELRETRNASRTADESMAYVLRYGKSRGVDVDAPAVNAESAMMFKRVRQDLHELAEELKELDDSRKIAAQFLRNPGSVLPLT
ncbi:hypothetical protein CC1G_05318 [Coprinopsis cinerea okayama7|uniref:Uncharacterized protein n=1 Tax=Coprinopsis cinerea (strain Okayama-7 / 130 / ATCC MYA-4618 / FGSC 9003) TaxID=240176 RepID=A8PCM1_COPC7|nr:hypothetical protein CC1G_05318 [Coprinopsis cinerea okayama7\|eukprot:XP_001840432.2 hypothetical protein CC1G_05318 [Coprinopsis cinerea okayama7\